MDSSEAREERIQVALGDIHAGNLSINAAASTYGIGHSTLHDRFHGAKTRHQAHEVEQKLSTRLELSIVQWILYEELANRPPTKTQVKSFASDLHRLAGGDGAIGKHWVDRFIQRHPRVQMKVGVPLEAERTAHSDKEHIEQFFRALNHVVTTKKVKTRNITNVDETGTSGREIQRHRVLGTVDSSTATISEIASDNWTTYLEAITGDGRRLTPVMVFEGENLQKQWFPKETPGWKYIQSKTGWSTAEIFHRWFTEVFLPETTPENRSEWRLLVLDGSSTHTSTSVMARAWHHRVFLLYLPSHTSHLSQPCDKGPFSPLKSFYREECAKVTFVPGTAPINKRLAIGCYKRASDKAFSRRNVLSGFSTTGIVPYNPQKVLRRLRLADNVEDDLQAEARPSTPQPRLEVLINSAIRTPRKAADLFAVANRLVDGTNQVQREVQTLVAKAGKALDSSLGEIATLRDENTRLNTLVEELRPRKRQRIQKDPNQAFADVRRVLGDVTNPPSPGQTPTQAQQAKARQISTTTAMYREHELEDSFYF